jgi:hypothetical protein
MDLSSSLQTTTAHPTPATGRFQPAAVDKTPDGMPIRRACRIPFGLTPKSSIWKRKGRKGAKANKHVQFDTLDSASTDIRELNGP